MLYPSSMSDEQWAVIEPVLPPPASSRGPGRPEAHPRRLVLDAVFYLVAEGIRWRALPKDFPPWSTVYGFFTRWRDEGPGSGCTTFCATRSVPWKAGTGRRRPR